MTGVAETSTIAGAAITFATLTVAYLGAMFSFWIIDEWTLPKDDQEEEKETPRVAS